MAIQRRGDCRPREDQQREPIGFANATLAITNIQPIQSGFYRVTVANQYGTNSSTAPISVLGPQSFALAWGDNSGNQTNVPAALNDVVAVAGGDYHSLGLRHDGSVIAWGYNGDGQTTVSTNALRFVSIAAAAGHNLAITENGSVVAWGRNDFAQCKVPPPPAIKFWRLPAATPIVLRYYRRE